MRRGITALAAVFVVVCALTGVFVWRTLKDDTGPAFPEISAYSHGDLTRVGPYRYCNVRDLNDCVDTQTQGELAVNERDPVQLSVDAGISNAPWRLLQAYEKPDDVVEQFFRPESRVAVTIPTVDPQRGRLTGVAVQLMTLVQEPSGQLFPVPHAEWSVRTVWR